MFSRYNNINMHPWITVTPHALQCPWSPSHAPSFTNNHSSESEGVSYLQPHPPAGRKKPCRPLQKRNIQTNQLNWCWQSLLITCIPFVCLQPCRTTPATSLPTGIKSLWIPTSPSNWSTGQMSREKVTDDHCSRTRSDSPTDFKLI